MTVLDLGALFDTDNQRGRIIDERTNKMSPHRLAMDYFVLKNDACHPTSNLVRLTRYYSLQHNGICVCQELCRMVFWVFITHVFVAIFLNENI